MIRLPFILIVQRTPTTPPPSIEGQSPPTTARTQESSSRRRQGRGGRTNGMRHVVRREVKIYELLVSFLGLFRFNVPPILSINMLIGLLVFLLMYFICFLLSLSFFFLSTPCSSSSATYLYFLGKQLNISDYLCTWSRMHLDKNKKCISHTLSALASSTRSVKICVQAIIKKTIFLKDETSHF